MSTLASICFSYLAAKWNNRRCLVTMIACLIPIAGTGVLYGVSRGSVPAQLVGLYLVSTFVDDLTLHRLTITVLHLLRPLLRRYLLGPSQYGGP